MGIIKNRRIKRARKKAKLEARAREVRYWRSKNLGYAAIAARMNIPESTVRNILKKEK